MMKKVVAVVSASFLLAGCAASPNNITPVYVSPLMYQHYSCDQISMELQRISARVSEVTGQQQRAANNDALAMGVGLVIFWPALFFLANDNDKREELARLRGEYDALQQAANMRSCFAPQPAQQAPMSSATQSSASPGTLPAPPEAPRIDQYREPVSSGAPEPTSAANAEPTQASPASASSAPVQSPEPRTVCRPRLNNPC